jgi:hypothetical protein
MAAVVAAPLLGLQPVDVLLSMKKFGPIDVSPTLLQELLATPDNEAFRN